MAAKLGLGFGLCVALTLFLGLTSTARLGALNKNAEALEKDSIVAFQALSDMAESATSAHANEFKSLLTADSTAKKEIQKQLDQDIEKLNSSFDAYEQSISLEEDRKLFEEAKSKWKAFDEARNKVMSIQGKVPNAIMQRNEQAFTEFNATLEGLVKWNKARAAQLTKEAHATYQSGVTQNIVTIVLSALIAIVACIVVTRSVTLPLAQVTDRMFKLRTICMQALRGAIEAMASGDLVHQMKTGTTPVDYESKDEIGQVAESFNSLLDNMKATIGTFEDARENLRGLIGDVSATATQVAGSSDSLSNTAARTRAASEEIAQTIQQVAHASGESAQTSAQIAGGSEQLAVGATEASNAMEKLDSAVQSVQEGSSEQLVATSKANEIAIEGGQAVQQTIASMERISKQVSLSEKAIRELGEKQAQIGAIVQAIDEIAEQTNLLALNAAIEAARAGEHGRGFAVVAEEVRKLAERSSASTKEIADLIANIREGVDQAIESMTASSEEVAEGSKSSDAAKAALAQILEAIANVQKLAQQNGKLVEGMTNDTRTVTDAISNVASVSEETAAGAQEMSASAEEMAAATQQAAAAVQEQTAGITEVSQMAGELKSAAAQLQSMVSAFKISNDQRKDATPELKVAA